MIIPYEGGHAYHPRSASSTTNVTVIMLAERIYRRVYAS
jgi:choline dehydrogenase-like flavoprotein